MSGSIYEDGEYLLEHPDWGAAGSPWKVEHLVFELRRAGLEPSTICEIGCGAGRVLRGVGQALHAGRMVGYDVFQEPLAQARALADERTIFEMRDVLVDPPAEHFELALLVDVIEHVEDYMGLIRRSAELADTVILHIPLELSVQAVLRNTMMRSRRRIGHLHYFSKDTALATVEDCGLRVLSWRLTPSGIDRPRSREARIMRLPRRLLFTASTDLACRMLGGYSLMVLARPE